MRRQKRHALHAALFTAFFALGWGLHSVSPPRGQMDEASTAATAASAWSWGGTSFTQAVRCEGVFSSFPGPRFRRAMPGPFRQASAKTLKFLEFNMLNLFERDFQLTDGEKFQKGTKPKSEEQREGLARIIRESDPDIMTWVEVENARAAELFSERYLGDKYEVFLIDGNDQRGIDVGVLVKKDLPFQVEYRSLKDIREEAATAENDNVFSRDLPVAIFRRLNPDGNAPAEAFIVLSTHYKSQRGEGGSFDKRHLQAQVTERVVGHLRQEFGEDVPIILTGDFNNHLPDSAEFAPLWQAGFKDAFDLVPASRQIPKDQRGTHYYFPMNKPLELNQLDGFLISGRGSFQVQETRILPHLDEQGRAMPHPRSFKERESRPSDHLAIEMTVDFQ